MSIALFLPLPSYVPHLLLEKPLTVRTLCGLAGVRCRASGQWTERKVEITAGSPIEVVAEPGDWGSVRIAIQSGSKLAKARLALAIMAYSIHDVVALESIRGAEWSRVALPRGRPKTGLALTGGERQRRFRAQLVKIPRTRN